MHVANNISLGMAADKAGDFDTAIYDYELFVNSKLTVTHPYDRLIAIYRAHKRWDDLERILRLVIDVHSEENEMKYQHRIKSYPEYKEQITAAHENNTQYRAYCHIWFELKGQPEKVIYNPYPVFKYILMLEKLTHAERGKY